jgi:hypothetical protein
MTAVLAANTFPIVDKLSTMAQNTMTTIAMSLIVAIGIVIAIGLIWSHIADRETGKWWKGLAVWAIGSGIILGIGGVTSWIQTNITV